MIVQEMERAVPDRQGKSYSTIDTANAASSASMISMIFKFFLQSGEYDFFIKRLRNVAATKVSSH